MQVEANTPGVSFQRLREHGHDQSAKEQGGKSQGQGEPEGRAPAEGVNGETTRRWDVDHGGFLLGEQLHQVMKSREEVVLPRLGFA